MSLDTELKRELRVDTGMSFGRSSPTTAEVEATTRRLLDAKLKQKRLSLDTTAREQLIREIRDDLLGYGPIEPLLRDATITEIMINGPDAVYVERHGQKVRAECRFDDEGHLRAALDKMLGQAGRRLDESSPYVDFSLADGSRINAIIAPVAADGTAVTIRKFLDTINSLDDLVQLHTLNEPMSRFLRAAVKARLNMIFSGATGSGKTSTLNVLSAEIAPEERLVSIEDALELRLNQRHVVRLLTRPANIEGKGSITVRQLFSNTLRMRPSRIILGEIRGEEALDFLQALNSGHDGTLAVLHAAAPVDAIGRLETLALYAGLDMPVADVRRQIASGLQLIIQHEQFADGSRKISHITELNGLHDGHIVLNDLFRYEITDVTAERRIVGEFRTLNRPACLERFRKRGVLIDDLF